MKRIDPTPSNFGWPTFDINFKDIYEKIAYKTIIAKTKTAMAKRRCMIDNNLSWFSKPTSNVTCH